MKKKLLFIGLGYFILVFSVSAQQFESVNFRVLDPILSSGWGSNSTSNSFKAYGSIGQLAIGIGSSLNFGVKGGFLYYPEISPPVVSVSAGDSKVSLSWTLAEGFLGLTVSSYNIGKAVNSGGPYTFSGVGNVLSSTVTGLTNNTLYYFIVRPEDFFGNSIATSTEVSATPVAGPSVADSGAGTFTGGSTPFLGPVSVPSVTTPSTQCQRSDFNCDTNVDLKDFSILLNKPEIVNNQILSFLFADWTKQLPIPTYTPESKYWIATAPTLITPTRRSLEIAQIIEIVSPSNALAAEQDSSQETPLDKIWNFIINIWKDFLSVFLKTKE